MCLNTIKILFWEKIYNIYIYRLAVIGDAPSFFNRALNRFDSNFDH